MIGVSKLYCGTVEPSDLLRYGQESKNLPSHLLQFAKKKKPVVVWNVTKRCNLTCMHCYSESNNQQYEGELSTEEGETLLENLSEYGVPVVLFSGGEPLMRKDLFHLIAMARKLGMRAVLSTNGTLITEKVAQELKSLGLSYAGISLDGLKEVHDKFRRKNGAFEQALQGVRHCREAGLKVGFRFTMNKQNMDDIPGMFDLIEKLEIPRICFYHLVQTGRGEDLQNLSLTAEETRNVLDLIMHRTKDLHERGKKVEVLTVDNHADGVYLYLKMVKEQHSGVENVLNLLKRNGGNSSGVGIGCVSWDGRVYPDQFWRNKPLGHIRKSSFSHIWEDTTHPLLAKLKNKKEHVKGRCARCGYLDICGGNFRVRAEALTGDIWASDPACYLTDKEIGIMKESNK